MKKLLLTAILSLPLAASGYAQENAENSFSEYGEMRGGKRGGGLMKKLKELGLSKDQLEKLKEIKSKKKENKDSRKADKEKMKNLREELKAAFKSNKSNDEVRSLHNQIKELKEKRQAEKFEMMLQIREILTPDQRAKFEFKHGKGHRKGR